MGLFIEDGLGKGKIAGVNDDNRVMTEAVTTSQMSDEALNGQAFIVGTPLRTITTTGGVMLWMKNTSDKLLKINRVLGFNNGGNTNYNRPVYVTFRFGDAEPTANTSIVEASNLNKNSALTADLEAYYWDEVGDGMTTSGVDSYLFGIMGVGMTNLQLNGTVLLGQNDTFAIEVRGVEASEFSAYVTFYY